MLISRISGRKRSGRRKPRRQKPAMPKGAKGEKRPADVIGNRIATGEEQEDITPANAAATLGKLGGKARAAGMTPERRAEIAKKAAAKRWGKS
jgi:hypothetical protein